MDYQNMIKELREDLASINEAIVSLARLARLRGQAGDGGDGGDGDGHELKRRGRKFMGPEERQEVSARMKRYWASRRKQA